MSLFTALRRTTDDDHGLPELPTDEDLLAWAEELRTTYAPRPRRTRQLVAAPLEG